MADDENGYTNIRIRRDTLERLKGLGKMGETYDDVIQKILPKRYRRGSVKKQRPMEKPATSTQET